MVACSVAGDVVEDLAVAGDVVEDLAVADELAAAAAAAAFSADPRAVHVVDRRSYAILGAAICTNAVLNG